MIRRIWKLNPFILPLFIVLSLIGTIAAYLATSGFGAGLSSDAIRIISTGQNFIEGRGLITSANAPLIFAPPYYSILLGLLAAAFHSDVFTIGMILNILTFGAIIFTSCLLFMNATPKYSWLAIGLGLIVVTSPSLIRICANVAPDPLFILWVIVFLLFAGEFHRNPNHRSILAMFFPALLAASQRYLGLSVVLAGAVMILWQNRGKFFRGGIQAGVFALLASGPTVGYILFHNYLGYGTLTGPRFDAQPLANIRIALEKLVHWFVPGAITTHTGYWIWVALATVVLVAGIFLLKKRGGLRILLLQNTFLPNLFFLVIYGLTLIFMLSTKEHRPLLWDRIHIVLLVPILVVLANWIKVVFQPVLEHSPRWSILIVPALFLVWLAYPVVSSYKYIVASIQNGEASLYNIHNTRAIRDSQLAIYLESHAFPNTARLYSNYNETAWFLTRRQVLGVPSTSNDQGWPSVEQETYLIWFNLPELSYMPQSMLTITEISAMVDLIPVYIGADGSIYRMSHP